MWVRGSSRVLIWEARDLEFFTLPGIESGDTFPLPRGPAIRVGEVWTSRSKESLRKLAECRVPRALADHNYEAELRRRNGCFKSAGG
jgi:hypothetical protein